VALSLITFIVLPLYSQRYFDIDCRAKSFLTAYRNPVILAISQLQPFIRNSLIYITSVKKFTAALGLRMALDNSSSVAWNQVLAMSVVAVVPCILVFFFAQKYFVEGISSTGIKG
jgi:ABC-type glycerol-3-phosphate transport system permease component